MTVDDLRVTRGRKMIMLYPEIVSYNLNHFFLTFNCSAAYSIAVVS